MPTMLAPVRGLGIDKRLITSSLVSTAMFLEPAYRWAPFHREIAAALEDDSLTRLIISVPPQHYKSTLASVMYPLWKIGSNPDLSIIMASYSAELAERHSYRAMSYFQSEQYRSLYGLELDRNVCGKGHWRIDGHRGSFTATGIGGFGTGAPADIAIVDDFYANSKEANSETIRKSVESWYRTVLCTRLQSEYSRIIIIATRWHENDLIGMLLNEDKEHKWKPLVYPALLDYKGEDFFTGRPLLKSMDFYRSQIGLDAMSTTEFETMFMCNPKPRGDAMILPEDWTVVPHLPEGIVRKRVRGHDIAYTGTSSSDDSANALLVRVGKEVFLVDADSWVEPWHVTKEKEKKTMLGDDPGILQMFELNGGQSALVDDFKRDADLYGKPIFGTESSEKKQVRALPWILRVKDKQIKMVDGPHKQKVFDQCSHFRASGDARYDGIIDSISKAWEAMANTVDLGAWT
jgi:Terminase large subunit, T4likevirus-type, N-terminal